MAAGGPLLQLPTARTGWRNIPNPSQWKVLTILMGHPVQRAEHIFAPHRIIFLRHIASSDYSMPHVNLAHVEEFACLVYIVTSLHLAICASRLICRVTHKDG